VKKWSIKRNYDGLYDCRFPTEMNDPTGYWKLAMELGGQIYNQTIRIETIRPNRLKMLMDFADDSCIKKDMDKTAPIMVKWMHGLWVRQKIIPLWYGSVMQMGKG